MLSVWVQEAHVQYVCAICGKGDATPLELSTAAGRGSQEWGVGERGAQGLWQRMGFGGVEWGQYGRWKGEEWLSQLVCAHTM